MPVETDMENPMWIENHIENEEEKENFISLEREMKILEPLSRDSKEEEKEDFESGKADSKIIWCNTESELLANTLIFEQSNNLGQWIYSKEKPVGYITSDNSRIFKVRFPEYESYPEAFTNAGVGKMKFLQQFPEFKKGINNDPFYKLMMDADVSGFYMRLRQELSEGEYSPSEYSVSGKADTENSELGSSDSVSVPLSRDTELLEGGYPPSRYSELESPNSEFSCPSLM